jgi:hypothetical protein
MVMKKLSQATLVESKKSSEPSKDGGEKAASETTKLIQKEGAAEVGMAVRWRLLHPLQGSVKLRVYMTYFQACGRGLSIAVLVLYAISAAASSLLSLQSFNCWSDVDSWI